jgi:hypothetical protein
VNTNSVGHDEPGCYRICLQGRLDERWAAWFDGMALTTSLGPSGDGVLTVLRGPVVDQAALHGLLARLRDIGLPLVSVTRVDPDTTDGQDPALERNER